MADIEEFLDQDINQTELIKGFNAKNSNKKRIWSIIFVVLIILVILGEFKIDSLIQGQSRIIQAKNDNNSAILNDIKDQGNGAMGSTASSLLSSPSP